MGCSRCRHDRDFDTDRRHERFDTGPDFFRPGRDTSDRMHDHHMDHRMDHHMEHEHRRRRRRRIVIIGFPRRSR